MTSNSTYRFVTIAGMPLRIILLLGFLSPTAASFFSRDSRLQRSVGGKIDNIGGIHDTESLFFRGAVKVDELPSQQKQKDDGSHDGDDINDEGLVFEGKYNYQSDTVPIPTSVMSPPAIDLFDFFSDPENRDLVIKGGGNQCENIPLTPKLHDEWTSQSKIVNSTPPDGNDADNASRNNEEILAVYSEVPIVPGLSLRAVSYTGCKTMVNSTSALPYYEFTLLKETYQPVGKKAMTWIFDKVTRNEKNIIKKHGGYDEDNSNNDDRTVWGGKQVRHKRGKTDDYLEASSSDANSRKTYALSRVTLEPFPQDGGCKICYYGHVKLTLSKRFLQMLPLPVGVVQAKVNESIKRQLERECTRSIEKFTRELSKWDERRVIQT
mmetsp:Transcript_19920/g.43296  ORF Transcript_19920/g.43296 Transcript_19920/m.43296 type:complete len:379 (-) Transcript_19920:768-1904(-)